MPRSLPFTVLSLAVFAHAASAQVPAQLEPVVVNASRIPTAADELPLAVSVIGEEEIQGARQQLGLDEALSSVPGLFFQDRYNFAQDLRIAIRGFGAQASFGIRGIRMYADGIPLTLPDGQASVDAVDLGSAERIEVVRGPFSSVHGASSGGVIDIRSERGRQPPGGQLRLEGGAHGFRRAALKAGGRWDATSVLARLSSTELDGYRAHARVESDLFNANLQHEFAHGSLDLVLNAVDSPRADDPGALTAAELRADRRQAAPRNLLFDAGESLTQETLGATWTGGASAGREWRVRGWAVQRDFENRLPFDVNSNGQGGAVDLDRDFHGVGVAHAWLPPADAGAHRVVIGLDHELQHDRRRRFANEEGTRGALTTDQDEDVTATGVYLQDEWIPAEAWRVTAGLRWDRVEFDVADRTGLGGSGTVTFEEWSPLLGVNRALGDGLHAYANVARSFDTPTTTELANPVGPTGFNQGLDAQTATNYEIGLKSRRGSLRWELALFHIDIEDVLVPFEQAGSGQVFFENAGQSTRDGVEGAFEWAPAGGWTVSGALTWSDFRFDRFSNEAGARFDGNEEPGIPRWNAWFGLRWEPLESLELALDHRWVGAFYADNANQVRTDAYGVTDLRASWRFEAGDWVLTPHAGVNNLSAEEYNDNVRLNASFGRYFEPAPERNAYAGATLERRF